MCPCSIRTYNAKGTRDGEDFLLFPNKSSRAGPFSTTMVVSMRPIPKESVNSSPPIFSLFFLSFYSFRWRLLTF